MDWKEHLRRHGYRVTPQRIAILEAIETQDHPTAETVLVEVSRQFPSLNRTTVARTLATLGEQGLIEHTHFGGDATVYHLASTRPHLHVICVECGKQQSYEGPALGSLGAEIERSVDFHVDWSHTAMYGTCAECRAAAQAEGTSEEAD